MSSLRRYRISLIVLLSALAVSSGTSVYLYELRQNDLNSSVAQSANLDKQISDLNNQIALLRIQIDQMQHGSSPDSQNSLKAQIAQLTITINSLQATNASQALEIKSLQVEVQSLQSLIASLSNPLILNGAGAIFPSPFLAAVAQNYTRTNLGVEINYQPIGSGGGIKALTSLTVDFAATDLPLSPAQTAAMTGQPLIIPETIGAVVLAYNVLENDGVTRLPTGLNLNATLIARIFLSASSQPVYWDDSAIVQLNPTLQSVLPHQPIIPVHRSDGSGTTFVFTGYLNTAASSVWTLGQNNVVAWPGGLGASGSQGVAGVVLGTTYTMGYVELASALTNPMTYGFVRNADGNNFVKPSLVTVTNAVNNATAAVTLPKGNQSWTGVSLLNAKGLDSYPIVSFSYLVVYKELNILPGMTLDKATALVDFLWFTVHSGQTLASPLAYVSLSNGVTAIDEASLESMTFNGQAILPTLHIVSNP